MRARSELIDKCLSGMIGMENCDCGCQCSRPENILTMLEELCECSGSVDVVIHTHKTHKTCSFPKQTPIHNTQSLQHPCKELSCSSSRARRPWSSVLSRAAKAVNQHGSVQRHQDVAVLLGNPQHGNVHLRSSTPSALEIMHQG